MSNTIPLSISITLQRTKILKLDDLVKLKLAKMSYTCVYITKVRAFVNYSNYIILVQEYEEITDQQNVKVTLIVTVSPQEVQVSGHHLMTMLTEPKQSDTWGNK